MAIRGQEGCNVKARVSFALMIVLHAPLAWGQDWPQWGGRPDRNMVSEAKGLPDLADARSRIKWQSVLGTKTYGTPVVAGGNVFIGTNNFYPRNQQRTGDRGVLMCFDAVSGKFLWQLTVPKIPYFETFCGDMSGLGICSTPTVEGDRAYLVTNRCEVVCLDTKGLADGNDGPFTDEARYLAKPEEHRIEEGPDGPIITFRPGKPVELDPTDADIIWRFDMIERAAAWPIEACDSAILIQGDYLYAATSNGVDRTHKRTASFLAPSLVVLDKRTGQFIAGDDAGIADRVFHGQWSSPSAGTVNTRPLVFYGGGDGFCYAFDATPVRVGPGPRRVLHEAWRFDANPPEYRTRDGKPLPYNKSAEGPSEIDATPVFYRNRVYVAIGQDPTHGPGKGCLSCIDASGTGDITATGAVWQNRNISRTVGTCAISDGLLYVAETAGTVYCLDAETGQECWKHELGAQIWSSPLAADGKLYIPTVKGDVWVFATGKEKRVVGRGIMNDPIYTSPVASGGILFVASNAFLCAMELAPAAGP
jgi:outer membrane protein assembly factor BamB